MAWLHPEIQFGEVLLRNMTAVEFATLDYSSKRAGLTTYDGEGNKLNFQDWFPVFIQKRELKERDVSISKLRKSLR